MSDNNNQTPPENSTSQAANEPVNHGAQNSDLKPEKRGGLSTTFNRFRGSKFGKFLLPLIVIIIPLGIIGHFSGDRTADEIKITNTGETDYLSNRPDGLQSTPFPGTIFNTGKTTYSECTFVTDGSISMNLGCTESEEFSPTTKQIKSGNLLSNMDDGFNFIEVSKKAFKDGFNRACYAFKSDEIFIDMGCDISNETDPSLDTEIFRSTFINESPHLDRIPNGILDINTKISDDENEFRRCVIIKDERSFFKDFFHLPVSLPFVPKTPINITYDCKTVESTTLKDHVLYLAKSNKTLSSTKLNSRQDIRVDKTIHNQASAIGLEVFTGEKDQIMKIKGKRNSML